MAKSSLNGSKGSNFIAKLTSEWFNQEVEVCKQRIWVDVENKEPKMIFESRSCSYAALQKH